MAEIWNILYLVDSSYQDGSIRLEGGDYNWEGRVEIFYSGTWSSISDTSWTSSDARVVCRQLRHSTEGCVVIVQITHYKHCIVCSPNFVVPIGAEAHCCSYYGKDNGPVLVSSVSCSGSEENITSCSYSNTTVYDHQNDVGVKCHRGKFCMCLSLH